LDCGISVYWMPVDTGALDISINFAVRKTTDGFVALGFPEGTALKMIGSDAVIGWVGSDVSVAAYHLEAKSEANIVSNTMMNVTQTSATEENGVTTIYFTRLMAAGFNPILDLAAVTVIASTLEGFDGIRKHSCRVNQAFVLNLETGSGVQGDGGSYTLKDAHGALMIIGWGVFLIPGMLVARYGKNALGNGLWFQVHQGFQLFGMTLTTTAFIISWIMVDGIFFDTLFHAQLGLTVMILAYLQTLGGILRPHVSQENEEKTPARKVFEIVHPWMGRIIILAAIVTIFAGISTLWHWWVHIVFGIVCGIYALVVIAGEATGQTKQDGYSKA